MNNNNNNTAFSGATPLCETPCETPPRVVRQYGNQTGAAAADSISRGSSSAIIDASLDNNSVNDVIGELRIMRKRWRQIDKRLTNIEAHLESSELTLARLRDFLDKQAIKDARETNRALRSRVPMPFQPSHSSSEVDLQHRTQHHHQHQQLEQTASPLYAPFIMPSMARFFRVPQSLRTNEDEDDDDDKDE